MDNHFFNALSKNQDCKCFICLEQISTTFSTKYSNDINVMYDTMYPLEVELPKKQEYDCDKELSNFLLIHENCNDINNYDNILSQGKEDKCLVVDYMEVVKYYHNFIIGKKHADLFDSFKSVDLYFFCLLKSCNLIKSTWIDSISLSEHFRQGNYSFDELDLDKYFIKRYNKNSVFEFGKYKGESVDAVAKKDLDYIVWCINTVDSFLLDNVVFFEYYFKLFTRESSKRSWEWLLEQLSIISKNYLSEEETKQKIHINIPSANLLRIVENCTDEKKYKSLYTNSLGIFFKTIEKQYKKNEMKRFLKSQPKSRDSYSSSSHFPSLSEVARDEMRSMDYETGGSWRDM